MIETSLTKNLEILAHEEQGFTVSIRRKLHEIPELSWKEDKTLGFIKEAIFKLTQNKSHMTLQEYRGGLALDVCTAEDLPWALFRADIDALPIEEKTELPFRSKHKNVMHACGHDAHASFLLGFLKIICENSIPLKQNIRLVWQRAEEDALYASGAKSLIQEGILKNIDRVYALHINSLLEDGCFFSKPNEFLANPASIQLTLHSESSHVQEAGNSSNLIDALAEIHHNVKLIPSKLFGKENKLIFTPTSMESGLACNILPNQAKIIYTLRNFLTVSKKKFFMKKLHETIESILKNYPGCSLETLKIVDTCPLVNNCESNYHFVASALQKYHQKTSLLDKLFAGDDFAYFLQRTVGSYWILGARQNNYPHHHAKFNPSEENLWKGVLFWLVIATTKEK